MEPAPSVVPLVRLAWGDLVGHARVLIAFQAVFKLLEAWLLVPVVAMLFSTVLARSGHVAVSNADIAGFLLTPWGAFYATLVGTAGVGMLLIEQAWIMLLVAPRPDSRGRLTALLWGLAANLGRVLRLGFLMLLVLAVALVPVLLLAALTHGLLLSGHDIYFYWKVRPAAFWQAAAVGAVLLAVAAAIVATCYVRWSLALPIMLFEGTRPAAALRASRLRTRGVAWRVAAILLGWQLVAVSAGIAGMALFRLFAATVLAASEQRPVVPILLLLAAQGGLVALGSFVRVVGQALLKWRLHLARGGALGPSQVAERLLQDGAVGVSADAYSLAGESKIRSAGPTAALQGEQLDSADQHEQAPALTSREGRWAWAVLALVLAAPVALWANTAWELATQQPVEITAHRGHARAAPENTLAAIERAITSGADYAEIDVQATADGVVVLAHDRDLKRVAGASHRIDDLTFDEIRQFDVGSWFDPAFANERVPTLREVIELARGRIRLNIELKFYGSERQLADVVAALVRDEKFEDQCLVTSLAYDGLVAARRENPRLRVGLIVAHALGDVSRLDVDALSVRADFLSDELLSAARRLGREVHVWTVNDPRQMAAEMKRGVDNLITSDPDLAIQVRREWTELPPSEQLVLASRMLLGLGM